MVDSNENRKNTKDHTDGAEVPAGDERLDNRRGDQRPPTDLPLKPQQVHGGYPGDDTEYEDPPSGKPTTVHQAEGPHGRGPQAGAPSED